MEKIYRLTIDLKAHINDEVADTNTWENLTHIHRFMEKMKADDTALLEFYKIQVNDDLLTICNQEDVKEVFKIKKEFEIIKPLLLLLNPENAEFISNLFNDEGNIDINTLEDNRDLIYNQFNVMKIITADFIEI